MKSEIISNFLQERIEAKDFPSAVYLVAEKGEIVLQDALGFAVVEPEEIEAKIDTIYDLASLTKSLVTGLLCAKLIEQNKLKFEDKLFQFFILFNREQKSKITVRNLLTHTSGFPAWLPFYLITDTCLRSIYLSFIADEQLQTEPQTQVVYSDLNFLILTFLIERFYNNKIDKIATENIFELLKLQNTFYNPPKELQNRIGASEKGNEFEKQTCIEQDYLKPSATADGSDKFRDYQIWGEVHDGNCYFMNGVSGH
ncbi:MAG: serine hydrolase, partial [Acidobacteriota bacterium]